MSALTPAAVPGTPVTLTRLGFGCARLFAGIEGRASRRLIETALAAGIRHFDTAPSYSWGQAEHVLGEVLAGSKDVTITTKVGLQCAGGRPSALGTAYRLIGRPVLAHLPHLKARLLRSAAVSRGTPPPLPSEQRSISRAEILASLEQSLRRLRRDHVDLLLLHEPDHIRLDEPTFAEFRELHQRGIVRAFGLGYDRIVTDPPHFGQVLQSRLDPSAHALNERRDILRIWHGVLRSANASGAAPNRTGAARRIQSVLLQHPTDVVLFSASARRQILEAACAINSV